MQLVVMAAVLALAGAGWDCSSNCHLTSMRISVESCNKSESFYTTACEGQCYNTDPVYIGPQDWPKQNICDGDWSYEVKHIEGCPVGVTYPVARSCKCTLCNPDGNTDCEPYHGHIASCMPEP